MEDFRDYIIVVIAAGFWILQAIGKMMKARREAQSLPVPPPPVPLPAPAAPAPRLPVATVAEEQVRQSILQGLGELVTQAASLADRVRHERPNRRFLDVLERYVPDEAARLRVAVAGPIDRRLIGHLDALAVVVNEIDELCRQRRDPAVLAELGDADTLADACYGPIVTYCQANGLPLTTAQPATQLADFELAIWTGFIPTQVAPIFLPPAFFQSAAWWPALAHEIGHDFFHSVKGFDGALRADLGLPSEEIGTRLLGFGPEGLGAHELRRTLAGWLEELFCDVFATMMCGPAYLATMDALFRARQDVREILVVDLDGSGRRYDPHPPRHLRFLAGALVLGRMGFHAEASRLRAAWEARHTGGDRPPDRLLFPLPGAMGGGQLLAVPLEAFTQFLEVIVERIVAGPLTGLAGVGLEDVPGLDYGPHEHAEGDRARQSLLLGRVPAVRDPRAVIVGAVLAALEQPSLEPHILAYARDAIPALGTGEVRPDEYAMTPPRAHAGSLLGALDAAVLRDAVVLGEILRRPGS